MTGDCDPQTWTSAVARACGKAITYKDPILLMHGEVDDNSGTFPIQSERLYMALKGHGATVRYVTLPFEAHGYAGRETLLHVLAERINWFDKHLKNAPPRTN